MLQGQVAIVTGGAKGIGRYIAHGLARDGAKLAIADVDEARMARTVDEIGAMGTEVIAVTTDVRDEDQVRRLMERVASHYGQIDVLINDAGLVPHFSWGIPRWPNVRDMDLEFWNRIMDTNMGGTFLCTKHVLPYMERRRSGHVVNLHGGGSGSGSAVYVVSKDAIRTFTKFVAGEEREHNVCIVVISPGAAIATEDAPEEARQRMPGPEFAGERFVLGAQAPMDLSGQLLTVKDGRLVIDEEG